MIEASHPDGGAMWLNSAHYQEPDAPHDNITDSNGVGWYAMHPHASAPEFESDAANNSSEAMGGYGFGGLPIGSPDYFFGGLSGSVSGSSFGVLPDSPTGYSSETVPDNVSGCDSGDIAGGTHVHGIGNLPGGASDSFAVGATGGAEYTNMSDMPGYGHSEAAADYSRAQFAQFMPGYETPVSQIDTSRHGDGMIEVRHADGSGTQFYDRTQYQAPRGDHQVFEDNRGGQWYAVPGLPTVEHRPVFEERKPVYDGDKLRTVNAAGIRYKSTPAKFDEPNKRDPNDRKPPSPKRR
jgi:hypothetical protein